MYNNKNYAIMEKFIYSNELSMLKFYGITIRLNVVIVDNKPNCWIVTKRTCNKKDEETFNINDMQAAIAKYKDLIGTCKTPWGNEIKDLLP